MEKMKSSTNYLREHLCKQCIIAVSSFQHLKALCVTLLLMLSLFFYLEKGKSDKYEDDLKFNNPEHLTSASENQRIKLRPVDLKRKAILQMMCELYANKTGYEENCVPEKSRFNHILVDKKHKLLYCYVPKVASTNWKRMLMILTDQANTTNPTEIPASVAHSKDLFVRLSSFSSKEIQNFLDTYTKFFIVRHPFERVLSAYRNKLQQHHLSSKYFQVRFGRHIIRHYRETPSQEALLTGNDVHFHEFVQYLTNPKEFVLNEHWMPVYNLCDPCSINYDVIGKYETIVEDSQHILSTIGEPNLVFPKAPKQTSTSSQLNTYFSSLPKELKWKLYDVYLMDLKLFGYGIKGFL